MNRYRVAIKGDIVVFADDVEEARTKANEYLQEIRKETRLISPGLTLQTGKVKEARI